jgi:hypothetical protein
MLDHLFVIGYPSDIGGANTELWHTVKLWRRFGLGVTLVPTAEPDPKWRTRLDAIGCRTADDLRFMIYDCRLKSDSASHKSEIINHKSPVPPVVVAFCNERFLAAADSFRELGCRIVWLGCMNWLFPTERLHYARRGCFDRHVFQSRYQRAQLVPQLRRFGFRDEQGAVIRGAFDATEFPFRPRPHAPSETFTIGRISRAAADKFSPQTWRICGRIREAIACGTGVRPAVGRSFTASLPGRSEAPSHILGQSPLRARVLGWSTEVEARVGPPPEWAECLPAGSCPSQEFLATLGALVHAGGTAAENWPRVGLEAMAAGVPVVADRRGGWPNMIRHGETGYLCDDELQFADYTARLANDEPLRQAIIQRARHSLETELADPAAIWAAWQQLFEGLDR